MGEGVPVHGEVRVPWNGRLREGPRGLQEGRCKCWDVAVISVHVSKSKCGEKVWLR